MIRSTSGCHATLFDELLMIRTLRFVYSVTLLISASGFQVTLFDVFFGKVTIVGIELSWCYHDHHCIGSFIDSFRMLMLNSEDDALCARKGCYQHPHE